MGCTLCLGLFVMLQPSIHTADILSFPASSSQCWVCRRGVCRREVYRRGGGCRRGPSQSLFGDKTPFCLGSVLAAPLLNAALERI